MFGRTVLTFSVMMLLILNNASRLTPAVFDTPYRSDNGLETCLDVVKTLIREYIQSFKTTLREYEVLEERAYTQYTGFKTYVFRLNLSNALRLDVTVSLVNRECYVIKFEVMLDFRSLNVTERQVVPEVIFNNVVRMFNNFRNSTLTYGNVSVIGGQLLISEIPVYFFRKDTVSLIPAMLTYRVYSTPPISYYVIINEYPILKGLIEVSKIKFNLSEVEALNKLKEAFNIFSYRKVFKALLIYEARIRPAYVVVIDPSTTAVVMGDTGEVYHPLYSGLTRTVETSVRTYPTLTYVIYLTLITAVFILTFLIYFKKLRSVKPFTHILTQRLEVF